eukprot:gene274-1603_t
MAEEPDDLEVLPSEEELYSGISAVAQQDDEGAAKDISTYGPPMVDLTYDLLRSDNEERVREQVERDSEGKLGSADTDACQLALGLTVQCARFMDEEVVEEMAVPLFTCLAAHKDFRVQEAVAETLPSLLSKLPSDSRRRVSASLIPPLGACSVWSVRRAVAISIPKVVPLLWGRDANLTIGVPLSSDANLTIGAPLSRGSNLSIGAPLSSGANLTMGVPLISEAPPTRDAPSPLPSPPPSPPDASCSDRQPGSQTEPLSGCLPVQDIDTMAVSSTQTEEGMDEGVVSEKDFDMLTVSSIQPEEGIDEGVMKTINDLVHLVLQDLSTDVSQWVRSATLQSSGSLICGLPPRLVTLDLVSLYVASATARTPSSAARPQRGAAGRSASEVVMACAKCLPGVAERYASSQWGSQLPSPATSEDPSGPGFIAQVYRALLGSEDPAVIRTVIQGLPRVAAALVPKSSQCRDFTPGTPQEGASISKPVDTSWLVDPLVALIPQGKLVDVRTDLAAILLPLLSELPDEVHLDLVSILPQLLGSDDPSESLVQGGLGQGGLPSDGGAGQSMVHSCGDWRSRKALAEQLSGLVECVGPELAKQTIDPCRERLCRDPVWAVRKAAGACDVQQPQEQ